MCASTRCLIRLKIIKLQKFILIDNLLCSRKLLLQNILNHIVALLLKFHFQMQVYITNDKIKREFFKQKDVY